VSEPYLATLPAPERILLSNLSLTMAVEFQFPAKNLQNLLKIEIFFKALTTSVPQKINKEQNASSR
jgi:hypothetical protein